MKSESSKRIDEVITKGAKAVLKQRGFKKSGRSFYKEDGDFVQSIEFQSSQNNNPERADFAVNLNIVLPYFHEKWTNTPTPKNPAKAAAIISTRLGGERWWHITLETDLEVIAKEINDLLSSQGLPFLEENSDINNIIALVNSNAKPAYTAYNPKIVSAIIHSYLGEYAQAKVAIDNLKSTNKVKAFDKTIELIENRLQC